MWTRGGELGWDGPRWDRLAAVTAASAGFFAAELEARTADRGWAPRYLAARGFRPQAWRRWGVGYAPGSWTALTRYLRGLGFPDETLVAAGLARRTRRGTLADVFRDRVMFPVRTADGIVAGFIGRAPPGPAPPAGGRPVYLNTASTPLYHKAELLFGLYEARQALAAGAVPVLTEGPLDAIAVSAAAPGRYAGLAPCGTALTGTQVALLADVADLAATGVVVAFDGDQAGQAASIRAHHLLARATPTASAGAAVAAIAITCLGLPSGQDPAGYLRESGPRRLAELLDTGRFPLADLVVDARTDEFARWLEYPEGIYNALHATAALIARLPPGSVARQVQRTATRLGLRHEEVTEALIAAVQNTRPA